MRKKIEGNPINKEIIKDSVYSAAATARANSGVRFCSLDFAISPAGDSL